MGKRCTCNALMVLVFILALCGASRTYGESVLGRDEIPGMTTEEATEESGREAVIPSEEQMTGEPEQLVDLTDAFDVILNGATKEFIAGYAVDETFLMWLAGQYGDDAVMRVACCVLDGCVDVNSWYEITGDSIHVLWLRFCQSIGSGAGNFKNVYWQDTSDEDRAVFAFTGDINFAEDWYTTDYMEQQENGILDCFSEDLLTDLRQADVLLMNNEFTYVKENRGAPLPGKAYTFRAEPEMVQLLSEFGADIVSLANNHTYDYGEIGLLDTMSYLNEAGIPYVGAGKDIDEASKIVYYVVNGRKVAIISATQIERTTRYTKAATEEEAGVFKALDPDLFLKTIKKAKSNSDYVIAVVHWGTEGALTPDASQCRLAKLVAEAGADVIIGGHPHRLQGAGFVENVPVAYSLGNFWFSDGTLYTTVAQVVIDREGGLTMQLLPCEQKNMVTRLLTEPEEISEFYHYLAGISENVGFDGEGNVYDKRAGDYPADDILYDAADIEQKSSGMLDNEGYVIDIVGNRR